MACIQYLEYRADGQLSIVEEREGIYINHEEFWERAWDIHIRTGEPQVPVPFSGEDWCVVDGFFSEESS